jgi:hypothetical protein
LEKIAVAEGQRWRVTDIVCSAGPRDPRFEEQHTRAVMTPGSLLLGNPGHYFECGHEHAVGDRCISFQYDPAYFGDDTPFPASTRVPPVRAIAALTSQVQAALAGSSRVSWEELAVSLAGQAVSPQTSGATAPFDAESRVTRVVRLLDAEPDQYVLRTRLRLAAVRLATTSDRVSKIALESGFGDLSNFNRTFRAEFGASPRAYRRQYV